MNEQVKETAELLYKTQKKNMEVQLENKALYRKCENLWQTLCGVRNVMGEDIPLELRAEINKVLTENNPSKND